MFAGTVLVTNSSSDSKPIVFNISSWSFSDGPMWRRSKVSSLRDFRVSVDAVSLVCVFSSSRRRASLRSGASSPRRRRVDAQSVTAAGRTDSSAAICARESAVFFISCRRVGALQRCERARRSYCGSGRRRARVQRLDRRLRVRIDVSNRLASGRGRRRLLADERSHQAHPGLRGARDSAHLCNRPPFTAFAGTDYQIAEAVTR